jgi:hypothetical protein
LWRFLNENDPDSPFFLEGAGRSENSIGTDWQTAVQAVLDEQPLDTALEKILWGRYQRTLSASSLDFLVDDASPSPGLTDHLLEVLQSDGARRALMGLERFGRESESLRPHIRDQLSFILQTKRYNKTLSASTLEETIRTLSK